MMHGCGIVVQPVRRLPPPIFFVAHKTLRSLPIFCSRSLAPAIREQAAVLSPDFGRLGLKCADLLAGLRASTRGVHDVPSEEAHENHGEAT